MNQISYIVRSDVPGDELPVRLQVFAPGDNLNPVRFAAGIGLASAIGNIERWTGLDAEHIEALIYNP